MLHGAYVEAIEAMEYAQGLGVLVKEDVSLLLKEDGGSLLTEII